LHRDLGDGALDVAEIIGHQVDASRPDVLLQPVQFCGAGDRHDPRLLSQQPGERDLGGCCLLAFRDLAKQSTRTWFAFPASGVKRGTILRKSVLSNFVFSLSRP
jgi:hypothetical protein